MLHYLKCVWSFIVLRLAYLLIYTSVLFNTKKLVKHNVLSGIPFTTPTNHAQPLHP